MEPKNYPMPLNSYSYNLLPPASHSPLIISDVVRGRTSPLVSQIHSKSPPLIPSFPLPPATPLLNPSRISTKQPFEQPNIIQNSLGIRILTDISPHYQKKLTLQQTLSKEKLLNYVSRIIPQNPFTTRELIYFFDNFISVNFLQVKEKFISGNGSAHLIDSTHPFKDVDLFYFVQIDSTTNKHAFLDRVLSSIVLWLQHLLKEKGIDHETDYIEHEILNNKVKVIDEYNCYAQYKLNGIDLLIAAYDPVSNKVLMERSNVNPSFRLCLITNTMACYDIDGYSNQEGFELNEYLLKNRIFIVKHPEKVFKLHFRILLAWHYGYQIEKELLSVGLSSMHKELKKCPFTIQRQNFSFNKAHYEGDSNSKMLAFLNQCTFIGLEGDYEQKIRSLERMANQYLITSKYGSYSETLMQCALFLKNNPEHSFKLIMLLHITIFFNFLKKNENIKCYTSSSELFNGNFAKRSLFSIIINNKTYYLFAPYGPKFILSHFFKYIHEYEKDPSFKFIKYPYETLLTSLNLTSPFTSQSLKDVSKLIVDPLYFTHIVQFHNILNAVSKPEEEKNLDFVFIETPLVQFINNLKREALKFPTIPVSFTKALNLLNLYALEEGFVKHRSSSGVQFTFLIRQCYTNKIISDDSLIAIHRLITNECVNSLGRIQMQKLLKDPTIQRCLVSVFLKNLKNNPFKPKEELKESSFYHLIESYFSTNFQRDYFISWLQALYLQYRENKCPLILEALGKHFDSLFSKRINQGNNFTDTEMTLSLNILNAYLDLGKLDQMKGMFNRLSLILKEPKFGQKFPLLTSTMCQKFASLIFTHKLSKKKEIPINIGFDLIRILTASSHSEFLSYLTHIIKLYHENHQFQKKYKIKVIELLKDAEKLQPIKDWPRYKYQILITQLIQTKNVLLLQWACQSIFKISADNCEIDGLLVNFIKDISSLNDNTQINKCLEFICKETKYRNPILNLKLIEYFCKSPQKEMMKTVDNMISSLLIEFKTRPPSYQLRLQILNQLTLFWKKLCLQENEPQLNLECARQGFWLLSNENLYLYFNMIDVSKPNIWPYSINSKDEVLNYFRRGKTPDFFKNLIEIALSSQNQNAFIFSCHKLIRYQEFVTHEIFYFLLEQYNNLFHCQQENFQLFQALNTLFCQLPAEIFRANNQKEKTIFEETLITIYSLIDKDVQIELNTCFLFVGDKLLSYYLKHMISTVFKPNNNKITKIKEKKLKSDITETKIKESKETKLNSYMSKSTNQLEQRELFRNILLKRYASLAKTQMSENLLEKYNSDCIDLFTTDWQKMLALEALYENVCRLKVEKTEVVVKHFLNVADQMVPHFIPTGRKIFLNLCEFLDKHYCVSTDGIQLFRKINKMPFFVQKVDFISEQERDDWNLKRKFDVLLFNNLFVGFYHYKHYFNYTPNEFDEINQALTESYLHLHQTVRWTNAIDLSEVFRAHRLLITHATFWFLKTGDFFLLELLFNNILECGEKIPKQFSNHIGQLVHMSATKIIQLSLLVCSSLDLKFSSAEALKAEQFEFNPFANQTPREVGYSLDINDLIKGRNSKIPQPEHGEGPLKLFTFSLLLLERLSDERRNELAQPEYLKPLFEKVIFFTEQCIKQSHSKTQQNKLLIKDVINFILKATNSYVDVNLLKRLLKANK